MLVDVAEAPRESRVVQATLFLIPIFATLALYLPSGLLMPVRLLTLVAAFLALRQVLRTGLGAPRVFWGTGVVSALFVVFGGIAMLRYPEQTSWTSATHLGFIILTCLTLVTLATSRRALIASIWGWVVSGVVAGLVGLWEILTADHLPGNLPAQQFAGKLEGWNEISSFFDNPNLYAYHLVVTLLLLPVLWGALGKWKWFLLPLGLVFGYLLIRTDGRMALLTLALGVMLWCLRYRWSQLLALAGALVFALTALLDVPPGQQLRSFIDLALDNIQWTGTSTWVRAELARSGWWMVQHSDYLGVGPGGYSVWALAPENPHRFDVLNNPHWGMVEVLAEYGPLVLFALLLALFVGAVFALRSRVPADSNAPALDRSIMVGGAIAAVIVPLLSVSHSTWLRQPLTAVHMGLIVSMLAYAELQRRQTRIMGASARTDHADKKPRRVSLFVARLKERLEKHEFLKHLLVLMSGTAVAQILPIAASPIIARLYSPYEVGIYTAFMSLVAGLITLAAWRYDLAIVLPEKVEDARALAKVATKLNALTCAVAGLPLILFAGPISEMMRAPGLKPWLAGVGFVAWAFSQVSIFNYWCNRNKRYKLMSANRIGQSVTTTSTQLGFGALSLGTTGLVVSTFLGQLVAAGNLFRKTRKDIYGQPATSAKEMMTKYKNMPLLNGPTAILDTVRLNGTQLMIQFFFSSAALGQFGQAWKMLQTPAGLINSSLSQVFYQKLSVTPRGQMSRVVRAGIARSALIGVVPFALIYWLSPQLFPFVFGARWALAGQIGAALVPWLYVNFITSPISMLFLVTGRQGVLFWFGLPLTAGPLALLALFHTDILQTMVWLSLVMAGLLTVFLILALRVAAGYDRGVGADTTEAPDLTIAEVAVVENQLADDVDGR